MPTPDELRAALAEARADFAAALKEAGAAWDKKPAQGEGEQAWSPRQVAQHAIAAEIYFTTAVCTACGYPGLDPIQPKYASAGEAEQDFQRVVAKCDGRLKYVTETDLAMQHEQWGSVENLLQMNADHMREHAAQIRAAAS